MRKVGGKYIASNMEELIEDLKIIIKMAVYPT
jgi:hypothetical protein